MALAQLGGFLDDITYLWVAETVLRKHKRPLNARALVDYGLEDGLFPKSGLSRTPQKSMQARLSVDILNNTDSIFVRTARGKFFIRELISSPENNIDFKFTVYTAERRRPQPSTEMVLCITQDVYKKFINFQGIEFVGERNPLELLNGHDFVYIPRALAETDDRYKQVVTYTIIQYQSKILSFRRGAYNRTAAFLRGSFCIGFGGHVTEDDRDLFSMHDFGIRKNASREIYEELQLTNGPPRIDPSRMEFLGLLNDDSSDVGVRHLAVVLRYWIDDWGRWRNVTKGEASINNIRWIDTSKDNVSLSDFEYWSQMSFRSFFRSSLRMVPTYKIRRKSPFEGPHVLCIAGSIGSGKSVTTRMFRERLGYTAINSGRMLAEILRIPPIPETERGQFQAAAESFISGDDGPSLLGKRLALAVQHCGADKVLIDGIRHPATLDSLKQYSDLPVALLYVYTPPDVAYEMYKARENYHEQSISLTDFVKLYTAPVERQIRYLIGEADIITYNWLGVDGYERAIERLIGELYAT